MLELLALGVLMAAKANGDLEVILARAATDQTVNAMGITDPFDRAINYAALSIRSVSSEHEIPLPIHPLHGNMFTNLDCLFNENLYYGNDEVVWSLVDQVNMIAEAVSYPHRLYVKGSKVLSRTVES